MIDTILSALLPMVITFLLGFVAAWRHDFESKDASTLNRMVLLYAVPLALFAGTVTTSPRALSQDIRSSPCASPSLASTVWCFCFSVSFSTWK
jgi:malonate transporter